VKKRGGIGRTQPNRKRQGLKRSQNGVAKGCAFTSKNVIRRKEMLRGGARCRVKVYRKDQGGIKCG